VLGSPRRLVGFLLGLAALGVLAPLEFPDTGGAAATALGGSRPALAAGVTALMAIWWISEAFPIHWTACVPLGIYPFTRVFSEEPLRNAAGAALPYVDPYIFLFLGGMFIAAAMQQWNLHRRIALWIMSAIGSDPRRLLLGFLVATAFVSMWISNTATATMMVPIGIAVAAQLEARSGGRRLARYGAAIMLAIAYAANVGGIATKIGTAPNSQFAGFMAQRGVEISFLEYMAVGLPFTLLFIPVIWLALWRLGRGDAPRDQAAGAALAQARAELGPLQRGEWAVLAVFVTAAALWVAGKPLHDWLAPRVTGFALRSAHVEAGISVAAAIVLLLSSVRGERVLRLRSLRALPWESLLLLGGSFAMAAGVEASGLSALIGERMAVLRELDPFAQITVASLVTVALSAFASNVATIAVMLAVLADSVSPGHASTILFAATLSASCDFALPAGTPPNAIVFGSGYVTVPLMVRTGVLLDVAAALLAALWCGLVVPLVLG
jgi:sodium-dependent dicarboxylate transporter 2/3/5